MTDKEIVDQLMQVIPVGNIKTHTRENLVGRVEDFIKEIVDLTSQIEEMENDLSESDYREYELEVDNYWE